MLVDAEFPMKSAHPDVFFFGKGAAGWLRQAQPQPADVMLMTLQCHDPGHGRKPNGKD